MGRGQEKTACWGVVGRGASCFPQIPEAAKRAVDSQEDVAKGLHGWVEQKQPLERRFVSSAKITPSGPKWEVCSAPPAVREGWWLLVGISDRASEPRLNHTVGNWIGDSIV